MERFYQRNGALFLLSLMSLLPLRADDALSTKSLQPPHPVTADRLKKKDLTPAEKLLRDAEKLKASAADKRKKAARLELDGKTSHAVRLRMEASKLQEQAEHKEDEARKAASQPNPFSSNQPVPSDDKR